MRKIIIQAKKLLLIALTIVMVVSMIQARTWVTFAANVVDSGPYANVDLTDEQIKTPEIIKNTPENEVERPKRENGEYETKEAYDDYVESGWKEITTLRKYNAKTFEDPKTGEQKSFIYMGAIHFQDVDGSWQDYNTNLKVANEGLVKGFFNGPTTYTQTNGDVDISLPTNINEANPIGMNFDETKLSIVPDTDLTNPKLSNNVLSYEISDSQDTQVINIGLGVMINEKFYSDMPDELNYSYSVNEGYSLYANETKTTIAIVKNDEQKVVGTIPAPTIVDANKDPFNSFSTIEAVPGEVANTYTLKVGLKNLKALPSAIGYPINISTTTAIIPKATVQIYAINNFQPDITYGPGGQGLYDDMFLIGDNHATAMYFPMGIFKAFVSSGVASWQETIGQDREVTNATLNVFEFTSHGAIYPNESEIKVLRIENDYQGRPNNITWNKWLASGANLSAVTSTLASKYTDGFVKFNITDAISAWYSGAPDYGLMLDTTREDEGLIFLNHDSSNTNLSAFGGQDGRPYIEITHKKVAPVPNNLSLDDTSVNLRPFTSNQQGGLLYFQALGFDGVSRPGSLVDLEVYEADNPSNIVYRSNGLAISGYRQFPYYEAPLYPVIDQVQKYYGLSSNWQDPALLSTQSLKKDTLYQVRVKAKVINVDGTIKEEGQWVNGDTFQVYSVKSFDHIPRIMNFYSLVDKIILMKDNHMRDELVVEANEMFIRNPKKNQGQPYISTELSESDKKNIDGYLMGQGKHCEYGYEPINFNTGNFYYTNKDTSFIDFEKEIGLERNYNSMAKGTEGIFGRNWEFNWNKHITFLSNGDIFYFDGTGKRIKFTLNTDGTYLAQGGEVLTLTKKQVGTMPYSADTNYYDTVEGTPTTQTIDVPKYQYTITDKNDQIMTFNVNGYLDNIKMDAYNHYMGFEYNELGNLIKITSPTLKVTKLDYNVDGYVNMITLPDGNTMHYEYV